MNSEVVGRITIRPLRNGDRTVVQAVFDRLGPASRLLRFGGAKNVLSPGDLDSLSRVDGEHHVLVAWAGGEPVGTGRLARSGCSAEIAFAVVDEWQSHGVGSLLAERLAADARAAGITSFHAEIKRDNVRSQALLRRVQAA
jgi:GNAT superfamily N-acetyltransferase